MDDEKLARFERAANRLAEAFPQNTSQSTITISAGGVGVWLAVTACAAMMVMNLALLAMWVTHDRKIDALQHYLNAVYMMAPHLKPEDTK